MTRTPQILLVEDNEGDILLMKEVLADAEIENMVTVSRDGQEAITYLNQISSVDQAVPDLVLLDINLPKVDGKQVLQYVKTTPSLRKIPIIIFSTSSSQSDIKFCYNHNANCFITKPGF
jgi:CheY-like chemotaxis protein